MKIKTNSGIYIDVREDNIVSIGSISDSNFCYVIIKGDERVHRINISEKELRNNIKTLFK